MVVCCAYQCSEPLYFCEIMKKKIEIVFAGALVSFALVPMITLASSCFFVGDDGNIGISNSTPQHKLDVSGALYSRLVTVTDAASTTVNWNSGNIQSLILNTSNTTITLTNGQAGAEYKLILAQDATQDATGGRTITWPTSIKWMGGIAPTLTSNASSTDLVSLLYDGSYYLGSYGLNYQVPNTSIAFDNAITQQTNGGGNSLTFSYTTGGTNRYLFVGCLVQGGQAITGITYGGGAMTQINSLNTSNVSSNETSYLFGLAAPAVGSNNVVVTASGSATIACAASSYTGAQQTTAVEANNTVSSSGGTATVPITTATTNDWLVGFARMDSVPAVGSNTTNRGGSSLVDMMDTNGAQAPAGSHSMNYTGATNWNWLAAALKPANI